MFIDSPRLTEPDHPHVSSHETKIRKGFLSNWTIRCSRPEDEESTMFVGFP